MSELVDHLAELTGFRDRDVLDTTLASALRDLLQPRAVTVYRCVASSEGGDEHWITRSRLVRDDAAATSDSAWIDVEQLPALDTAPERARCLREQVVLALHGPPALTMFPLAADRGTVGVVEVETDKPLGPAAQRLVGSILRIVRNVQALLDYGERDALTGLQNRKTFDDNFDKLRQEQAQASLALSAADGGERRDEATPPAHWLGVVDIDHFKKVNDSYGHLIGDEVLLLLARLMRSTFRHHDRLYRFGGEEFVVLVRCANDVDAAMAFERLRVNVERYPFPQVGRLTVSAGFTQVRATDTATAAFARADRAVYYAKANGRNRVVSHAELLAQGLIEAGSTRPGDIELF